MRSSLLALAVLLMSACSSGGGDLNQLVEQPKAVGTPIADLNDPPRRKPAGSAVGADAVVVVGVDRFDETGRGDVGTVFVQDSQPRDWSGMLLYRPSVSPADLSLNPGDGVGFTGTWAPFAGPSTSPFRDGIILPEITNAAIAKVADWSAPAPRLVTIAELSTPDAMRLTGQLVEVQNVEVTGDFDPSRHEALLAAGAVNVKISSQLFGVDTQYGAKKGSKFSSVVGVLTFFYDFKICPRGTADLKP